MSLQRVSGERQPNERPHSVSFFRGNCCVELRNAVPEVTRARTVRVDAQPKPFWACALTRILMNMHNRADSIRERNPIISHHGI